MDSSPKCGTPTPVCNKHWFPQIAKQYKLAVLLGPIIALVLGLSSQGQSIIGAFHKLGLVSMPLASKASCAHNYTIEILSVDPVIFYINNFIKEVEINYFLEKYSPELETSLVYKEGFESVVDKRFRSSQSAFIPNSDPIAQCLNGRMQSLLGNLQHIDNEPLQLVRYQVSEKFNIHYDWFDQLNNNTWYGDAQNKPYNRLGSIFVYLSDNCTGGETYFPKVKGISDNADGDKFASTESGLGLLVKPKRGNAVFWNNLHMNGTGDERVAHAGMPVHSGTKFGLNMFSYYYPDIPIIGS